LVGAGGRKPFRHGRPEAVAGFAHIPGIGEWRRQPWRTDGLFDNGDNSFLKEFQQPHARVLAEQQPARGRVVALDDADRKFRRPERQLLVALCLLVIRAGNQLLRAIQDGAEKRVGRGKFGRLGQGPSNGRERTVGSSHRLGLLRQSRGLEDKGHQQRQGSPGEQQPPSGFNVGRIAFIGTAHQSRHEHEQFLPRLVVHGVLRGLNIVDDGRRDPRPSGIDSTDREPGYDLHHARRVAARSPAKAAHWNRPQHPEIEPFRHCLFPVTGRRGISAAGTGALGRCRLWADAGRNAMNCLEIRERALECWINIQGQTCYFRKNRAANESCNRAQS
jgi:hypothetical protein